MKIPSISIAILGLLVAIPLASSDVLKKMEFKKIERIVGQEVLEKFIGKSHLTVVYYYKKDLPRIKFFFKELDKSAEYLDLYGVKVGVVDCNAKENQDVKVCELSKVEDNVYTYRKGRMKEVHDYAAFYDTNAIMSNVLLGGSLLEPIDINRLFDANAIMSNMMLAGNQLLSLEFDTMFDVNSIMSNVLQLVMLRQVPIVQSPKEVRGLLSRMRGKHDVIFGHTKAIGTFDHRVFMEVAYAYQDKFKFALATDEQAITAFSDLPTEDEQSNIYFIFTKDIEDDETITGFQSIKYKADLTLPAFAKWAMLLSLPKMYNFPQDGSENPYANVDAPNVKLYYNEDNAQPVKEMARLIANYYWGTLTLTVIDMDEASSKETYPMEGKLPAISILMPQASEVFMNQPFETENIVSFLEMTLHSQMSPKMSEEERQQNYDSPAPPERHDDAPYIDHDALDVQDDEVADAVTKNKEPMPLDRVPALTDKTFPTTIEGANIALVYFYIPFDAMSMAFLRKYGEAANRLEGETKLSINRVNCYDWTDVCSLNNITIYPTLRVFEGGVKNWDYRGPRDTQELYSTFRLLELSPPVHDTDSARIKGYLEGTLESDVKSFTSVVVMGLFGKENKKELEVFSEVAKSSRDRILFVYSDSEDAKMIAQQYSTSTPAIIITRYEDTIQPHVVYSGKFETDALRRFIQDNKLPKLTTITPVVFPELYKRGQDFLILFTDDSEASQYQENTLREILQANLYNNVSFTLMPVPDETSVGYKVLHQYNKDAAVPYISYVDLKVGEVFNFESMVFDKELLLSWITGVTKRVVKPSAVLKDNEWKPVQRGYDFLKIIDWEKAEAKKKHKRQQEQHMEEFDREEMEAGEIVDNGDEETSRQELFELHNSRLYAKSGHKHPPPAGKEEVVGTSQPQKQEAVTSQQEMGQKHTGTDQKLGKKEENQETGQQRKAREVNEADKMKESSPRQKTAETYKKAEQKAGQKQERPSDKKDKSKTKHTEL